MDNDQTNFRTNRVKVIKEIYSDETSARNRNKQSQKKSLIQLTSADEVRALFDKSLVDKTKIVEYSKTLYATNPIYAKIIDYLANMFLWRYTVTPHKVYKNSKTKIKKQPKEDDYRLIYAHMLEVVDGLSIETKFPALLSMLLLQGGVYFTTYADEESITVDTILLPDKYCRKIGETQYGTAIIEFNFSYFDDLALSEKDLKTYFTNFPKEFSILYKKYKSSLGVPNAEWQKLDPHFSSGILLNEQSLPTYFYVLGSILDFEAYQRNEVEKSENMLKYLVVQSMPIYQDQPVFEMDEVKALHQSLRKVVDKGDHTRLITTFGDVELLKVQDTTSTSSEVTSPKNAYDLIFNNVGFNSNLFNSDNAEALTDSLVRDKGIMWKHVQALLNFYIIAINNWFDFKDYEADIDILPISSYTYKDDIDIYRQNATLGVGKLNYIVASGIKQRDIADLFALEDFLHLDRITPMQTSYTQTAEDRASESASDNNKGGETKDSKSVIEPAEQETEDTPSTDED